MTVDGSPLRVHYLELQFHGLTGKLPPELGRLSELRRLILRELHTNYEGDGLTGAIPPELGSLTKLVRLDLSGNFLSGRIPPELAGLAKLSRLDLSFNFLTGSVPLELASLPVSADLDYNNPSLCVPAALPDVDDQDLYTIVITTYIPPRQVGDGPWTPWYADYYHPAV